MPAAWCASRSRWQARLCPRDDAALAAALVAKAAERPRFGYRRLTTLLRRDGWVVNRKRVLRVYRLARLRLRKHRPWKQVSPPRSSRPIAPGPNAQWTLDLVDEFTRECLALRAEGLHPSWKVVTVLAEIVSARAVPRRLIVDDGPEFIAKALDAWAYAHGVEIYFTRRGKPVDNCYVESFHDKFRDECLSTHWFLDLADARYWIEAWHEDYNTVRPHSGLGGRTPRSMQRCLQVITSWSQLSPPQPN